MSRFLWFTVYICNVVSLWTSVNPATCFRRVIATADTAYPTVSTAVDGLNDNMSVKLLCVTLRYGKAFFVSGGSRECERIYRNVGRRLCFIFIFATLVIITRECAVERVRSHECVSVCQTVCQTVCLSVCL